MPTISRTQRSLALVSRGALVSLLALGASPGQRAGAAEPAPSPSPSPSATPGPRGGAAEGELPAYGQTMVVTASRTEETVVNAPVSITVVDAQKLETTPGDNYGDLLRGVPGLNVIQTSARDINFTARGATSTLSTGQLALLDGRSVYQDFFGFVAWDFLPVSFDEIQQIEVLRSPGSAIWGANALNGVINVRTKSPRDIQGFSGMVGGGERGTLQGAARWAGASEDWSYKLSTSYFEQDPWERKSTLPSGQPLPTGFNFRNEGTKQPKFDARVDYDRSESERFSFSGGGGFTTGLIHTGIGPFSVDSGTGVVYGRGSYTRGGLDASVYVNRLDGDATNVINGLDFIFKNTTLSAEVSDRVSWGSKQVLVFGATARTNGFDLSIAPRDSRRNEAGLFVEDQIHLTDAVAFNLGARLDWFDTIGTTLSPRTSVVLKPAPEHAIRFSYNRAYRAPSLVNNFLETRIPTATLPLPTGPFVVLSDAVGNEDLDEQTIDAFELGYTAILGGRATLSAAVYRNETKDSIDFFTRDIYTPQDPPPGWPLPPIVVATLPPLPRTFSYRNVGKVIDKGLELSLDYRFSKLLGGTVSYTYQAEPEVKDQNPLVPFETNFPPENQIGLSINGSHGSWFGSLGINYVGEAVWTDVLDARFNGTTPDYTLVSGAIGVRFLDDRYTVSVQGTNLTDRKVQQHAFGDIVRRKVVGEFRVRF